jgi:hypothetical protein
MDRRSNEHIAKKINAATGPLRGKNSRDSHRAIMTGLAFL